MEKKHVARWASHAKHITNCVGFDITSRRKGNLYIFIITTQVLILDCFLESCYFFFFFLPPTALYLLPQRKHSHEIKYRSCSLEFNRLKQSWKIASRHVIWLADYLILWISMRHGSLLYLHNYQLSMKLYCPRFWGHGHGEIEFTKPVKIKGNFSSADGQNLWQNVYFLFLWVRHNLYVQILWIPCLDRKRSPACRIGIR